MSDARAIYLFSYGTLQLPELQLEKYGRLLEGVSDVLSGYRLERLSVTDPEVLRLSGKSDHPIARFSGAESDRVSGVVFEISEQELAATDDYRSNSTAAWKSIWNQAAGRLPMCSAISG